MNRAERRMRARLAFQVPWVVARDACPDCGAPLCPTCGVETVLCECCGEFNCEACRVYVTPPVHGAN